MFRYFIIPVIVGISVFLAIFFIAPLILAETDIVASLARLSLGLSNFLFATMPPAIASYISNLNLALVATTAGLLAIPVTQLLVVIKDVFVGLLKAVAALRQRFHKEEAVPDLPSIDMDPRYQKPAKGGGILGKGLDSIDED